MFLVYFFLWKNRLVAHSIHSLQAGGTATDPTMPQQWLRYLSLMPIFQKRSGYFHSEGSVQGKLLLFLVFTFPYSDPIICFEMNCHPLPKLDISLCSSGGHNIGKIGCEFIRPRLHNFHGTGQPDPTIPSDFLDEMSLICSVNGSTSPNGAPSPVRSRSLVDSAVGSSSVSAGSVFGKNYYDSVLRGRGLLFADQQLMAHDKTADLVRAYASDDGATFRMDFARAMVMMSNFGVLTGSQGQVRINCSRLVSTT